MSIPYHVHTFPTASADEIRAGTSDEAAVSPLGLRAVGMTLVDGVTPPDTRPGFAQIYVDIADGDLKVKFGDGTVKTIVVDT